MSICEECGARECRVCSPQLAHQLHREIRQLQRLRRDCALMGGFLALAVGAMAATALAPSDARQIPVLVFCAAGLVLIWKAHPWRN